MKLNPIEIIKRIERKFDYLDQEDYLRVNRIIVRYSDNPDIVAEKLSDELQCSYETIYELLF